MLRRDEVRTVWATSGDFSMFGMKGVRENTPNVSSDGCLSEQSSSLRESKDDVDDVGPCSDCKLGVWGGDMVFGECGGVVPSADTINSIAFFSSAF